MHLVTGKLAKTKLITCQTNSDAMDQLGLKRYCCRRMIMTHVDLIEKLLKYVRDNPRKPSPYECAQVLRARGSEWRRCDQRPFTDRLCATGTPPTAATRRRTSCTSLQGTRRSDIETVTKSVLDWMHGVTDCGLFYVHGRGDGPRHALCALLRGAVEEVSGHSAGQGCRPLLGFRRNKIAEARDGRVEDCQGGKMECVHLQWPCGRILKAPETWAEEAYA